MRSLCITICLAFVSVGWSLAQTDEQTKPKDRESELIAAVKANNTERVASLSMLIADSVSTIDGERAINFYNQAQAAYRELGNNRGLALAIIGIGKMRDNAGDHLIAIERFNEAANIYRRTLVDKEGYARTIFMIGSSLYEMGKYDKASEALQRVETIAKQESLDGLLIETYSMLSLIYERLNDKEKTIYYYKSYSLASKKKEEEVKEIEAVEAEEEKEKTTKALTQKDQIIRKKDAEIKEIEEVRKSLEELSRLRKVEIEALLNEQKLKELELSEKEAQIDNQRLIRNLSLAGLVLILLYMFQLIRSNRLKQQANKRLARQNQIITQQKGENERQKELLLSNNLQLQVKQEKILLQQQKIDNIVVSLERANKEVKSQKDALEHQKYELERSNENIMALSLVGQQVTATLKQDDLLHIIHDNLVKFMDVSIFGIGVYDEEKDLLAFRGIDERGEELPDFVHTLSDLEHPITKCMERKMPVFISDLKQSSRYSLDFAFYPGSPQQSFSVVFLPLISNWRRVGVMTVQSFLTGAYNKLHISILQSIATYAAISLQNISAYEQLETARLTIENKSRSMLDSIRYGERIQRVILPSARSISHLFQDHFILYKPKDIVSGDFYWFKGNDDFAMLIAADCTGHGVPGAFMSMIGSVLLDEIINDKQTYDPAAILKELHKSIRQALQQAHTDNTDGMDMCVCFVEPDKKKGDKRLVFAGAKRPLYVVKDNEFMQVQGDRKSIGGRQKERERVFENKEIVLSPGDMIYLTSDGYPDQHNDRNKKFGSIRFKERLAAIAEYNCEQQKLLLEEELAKFQETRMQRDDITVLGFKI